VYTLLGNIPNTTKLECVQSGPNTEWGGASFSLLWLLGCVIDSVFGSNWRVLSERRGMRSGERPSGSWLPTGGRRWMTSTTPVQKDPNSTPWVTSRNRPYSSHLQKTLTRSLSRSSLSILPPITVTFFYTLRPLLLNWEMGMPSVDGWVYRSPKWNVSLSFSFQLTSLELHGFYSTHSDGSEQSTTWVRPTFPLPFQAPMGKLRMQRKKRD